MASSFIIKQDGQPIPSSGIELYFNGDWGYSVIIDVDINGVTNKNWVMDSGVFVGQTKQIDYPTGTKFENFKGRYVSTTSSPQVSGQLFFSPQSATVPLEYYTTVSVEPII